MKYRPDIDGLRAIAIILVLIYHGGIALFPSGFVGVDVFFVISGFLITGIIHEALNNRTFSFSDFYNRRLWRLQPVLICLVLFTSIATIFFFLPEDLLQYNRSARKSFLFISNLFFSKSATGYFSPDTHQLPLLHTWSLSVEWQCYFLLPIVMYALHRLFSKKNVVRAIYVLTLVSFCFTLHLSQNAPEQTYYQLSSRIFEFLIGSCTVFLSLKENRVNKIIFNLLGFAALITIFYIASLDKILIGYPNWYTLFICLATASLIALGQVNSTYASQLLQLRPVVFVGLLSYSLYIWHWPIFALLRYESIKETPAILFLAYTVTFIVGYISWRYIEKPSRKFKSIKFSYTFVSLLLIPVILTHLFAYFMKVNDGLPQRFSQELVTIYQQLDQYGSKKRSLCISNNKTDIEECKIGAKNKDSKTALLIGDSYSNHYWGFMDVLGKAANVSVLAQATSSCLALPDIYLYDWGYHKNRVYQECHDNTQRYYQMIKEHHYDYVIIGQIWNIYVAENVITHLDDERSLSLSKKRLEYALNDALQRITASGARPMIVKNTAVMEANIHDCFFKHIKTRTPYHPEQCNFPLVLLDTEQWFVALFEKMKEKYPQLIVIDPKKVQCLNNVCTAEINGVPVYRDVGHITDYASYQLGMRYLETFKNPLG